MHSSRKEEVYGSKTLYRELGYYIARLEQYERSLKFYDMAVAKTPDDKRALIGRSVSRARAVQCAGALQDINKVLETHPDDMFVLAHKTLNTYLICEFEEGLYRNMGLLQKYQKPDNFSLGVMQCSDAIQNCVGERTGRPLRDHFKIIRKIAYRKNYEDSLPYEPTPKYKGKKRRKVKIADPKAKQKDAAESDLEIKDSLHDAIPDPVKVPPLSQPFPYKPLQRYTTNIDNYMAERYLETMYLDKKFLKEMALLPGMTSPNKNGAQRIKKIASSGWKTVSYKQELMRTRRPFYFIKYHEATISGSLKKRQAELLEFQRKTTKREADAILARLIEAHKQHNLTEIVEQAEKLKAYCNFKPKRILPNKDSYLEALYDRVCKGYYETYWLDEKQPKAEQKETIRFLLGLPLHSDPPADILTPADYKRQADNYEKRLELSTDPAEMCWYYYTLARDYIELRKFELVQFNLRRCMQEAQNLELTRWSVLCSLLLTKCNLMQHFKDDAIAHMKNAIEAATQLNDKRMDNFLKKSLPMVEKVDVLALLGNQKLLEERQKKIVKVMTTDELKTEVAHLFSKMQAMPASRQMSVLPGIISKDDNQTKKRNPRLSIMPGGKKSGVPDDTIKDGPSPGGGAEFMNLVQFHV